MSSSKLEDQRSNTERTRENYHHGNLRTALIAGATDIIRQGGAEALSLRALAATIGVTHRASSAHFRNKDALVAAVLTNAYERLDRKLENALNVLEAPAVEQIVQAIATAYGAFARNEGELFLLMNGRRMNASGEHVDLERALQRVFGRVADAFSSKGIKKARLVELKSGKQDGELIALHVWACLSGVLVQRALGRIRVRDDLFETYMRDTAIRIAQGIR
ncbi:MAG: TetR/AcrR family transcriptional regulator [Pseudomonadota bacterium]